METKPDDIVRRISKTDSSVSFVATVPKGKPIEMIVWQLTLATKECGYTISDCLLLEKQDGCKIIFLHKHDSTQIISLVIHRSMKYYSKTAKIAIIIQNFVSADNTIANDFFNLDKPLTVALSALSEKAGWVATIAEQYKKESIILIPLESERAVPSALKPSIIMVHFDEKEIRSRITDYIRIIPNFSGFMNIYGSRAMGDSRVMKIILSEIEKHHGFFISSKTARHSVAEALAAQLQVPHGIALIEIDSTATEESIASSLAHAASQSLEKGSLIVSIPPTNASLQALKKSLDPLKHKGIELVYVSEIVNHPEDVKSARAPTIESRRK